MPVQVKASIWFTVCSIVQKALSIVTVPLFTRLMTTEQYGYYTTYVSWYHLLLVFTSLNLYYGVFNNAMLKYRNDRAGYISSMQGLVFTTTSLTFVIYLLLREQANVLLGMPTPLVLMLFFELLITPSLSFWMAEKRFEFKYRSIIIVTLIKTFANPILGIILVVFSERKEYARILSIVFVDGIICSIITVKQFIRGRTFYSKEYWRYALLFNLPLIPHYLSGQILNQSDRIMISNMVGNSAVAIYGVAYNIGLLMNIFTSSINGAYTPWFYQKVEKKDYDHIQGIIRTIVVFMACMAIVLMLFGPEVISLMGTRDYKTGVYCIPPVAASSFFMFLYNIYANVEFYYEKKYYVLFSSLCAAFLNVILNFFFIKKYGFIAAAYTTLISYILYTIIHFMFAIKICRKQGLPIQIFDSKFVMKLGAVIILLGIAMNGIYAYSFVRFGIVIMTLVVVLVSRKKIIMKLTETLIEIRK